MIAVSSLVCWFAVAWAGPSGDDPAGPSEAARVEEFRAARVEVVGFDEEAVLAALRLRLPRLAIDRHGGPPPDAVPHVYLQLARGEGEEGRVTVITSEGRAYERGFAIEVGQEVRIAASTAANLLFSIEQGAVAPDAEDVAIPGTAPTAVTEPASTAVTEPAPRVEPAPEPVKPAPPRAWDLGLGLHGTGVLGPGAPRNGGVFAGGGGGLELAARSPGGAVLALDVRGIGRDAGTFAVGRMRIGIAGGYALRRGRFELPVLAGVSVEPWWATQSGSAAPIYSGTTATSRAPLLGGFVRVTPALRFAVGRGSTAIRVGPRLELAGSFAVDDGVRVIGLRDGAGTSLARLGGLELGLGLEVAVQWSLTRR